MSALPARDPVMGDNNPPDEATLLRADLESRSEALLKRRDELVAAFARVPAEVADDVTAGRAADFIKQIAAASKNAESTRIAEKEPHLAASRVVDGFFKAITDPLAEIKKKVEARLTAYQRKKADDERRRREEEARLAREAAELASREAAQRANAVNTETDLALAIDAEETAARAANDAALAKADADAKPAELSRTRSDFGSVASLRTTWTFDGLDRSKIDLEALRQHIPEEALEKAVRAFIKAGGRELAGVRIFEHQSTVVR